MPKFLNDKNSRIVGYVYDRKLLNLVNCLPEIHGRAQLVHQLIGSYGLFKKCKLISISKPCTREELLAFHTKDFIDYVLKISCDDHSELEKIHHQQEIDQRNQINSTNKIICENNFIKERSKENEVFICENAQSISNDNQKEIDFSVNENLFGFEYDCPVILNLFDTISYLAASSISGAKAIIEKKCHYVINWFGGWHHAHRDEVSGFCYTNDIVFGILELLKSNFKRILYIDLDLHHGDGVEDSFAHTNKVVTLSFHKYEMGFFPGTGHIEPLNLDERCRYSSLNVPFKDGLVDEQFVWMFENIMKHLLPKVQPDVIVCQCGADGLSGDRMKSFSLTENSFKKCISLLLNESSPILFLGGGGYNLPNTARLWTILTGLIVGEKDLNFDIPEHEFFLQYGPGYELPITQSNIINKNSSNDLDETLERVKYFINKLSF